MYGTTATSETTKKGGPAHNPELFFVRGAFPVRDQSKRQSTAFGARTVGGFSQFFFFSPTFFAGPAFEGGAAQQHKPPKTGKKAKESGKAQKNISKGEKEEKRKRERKAIPSTLQSVEAGSPTLAYHQGHEHHEQLRQRHL
ncbi:hypothetical protein PR048_033761 [Dryococelus australis]|uniref:Uncharacterized protein n=1 Tax=Dryococelus australis TaxID=614101 RepID=A0ABQ9FZ10_9NEOP|nr:hypothetical protein PR048_033761 [Dryococelus australis]